MMTEFLDRAIAQFKNSPFSEQDAIATRATRAADRQIIQVCISSRLNIPVPITDH